jgi:hypothetical protein
MRHNVRITRWMLRHLDVSAVGAGDLVAAAQAMLGNATRAAAELGCWSADVLPVTEADRAVAAAATRKAREADRAGELVAALIARTRALAADPWDGAAHADLMIAATRTAPGQLRARPPATRAVGVLAFADELLAAPELLDAYAGAVTAADDLTLVIRAASHGLDETTAALGELVERAGLTDDDAADLLLIPAGDEASLLAAPIRFVYSRRVAPAAYRSLTRFDEHGLAALSGVDGRRTAYG